MSKKIAILLILFFGLLSVINLFHPGMPITHDGKDHVTRIANFYTSLSEGIIVPRWAKNLNWGYGHPILEFLYPLPSYVASFFHFLGFSLIDSTKIVLAIGMVFSGLFMFLWLSEFLEIPAALVGGLLYMFAPYRFVNVYVRGDIGENLAFVFMPLTLFFMYRFFKTRKSIHVVIGSIALAVLILSHNAISLMFLPFILLYSIFVFRNTKYFILNTLYFFLLGFGLSAFFWIPGLMEGKYTLRDIVTAGEYTKRFVTFSALIYGSWNYGQTGQFTQQLGIIQWIALLLSPFAFFKLKTVKQQYSILVAALAIFCLLAIFLMLPASKFFWERILLLQNFQFPWRFLSITVFATAVLGAMVIQIFSRKFQLVITAVVIVATIIFNLPYAHAQGYFSRSDSFFNGIYDGTTDTGESSPMWSVRFMEHRFNAPLEAIDGSASIRRIKRTSIDHVYTVTVQQHARLLENTLFFPYWEVFIDGKKTNIEFQDFQHRGLITFLVNKGKHTIEVRYTNTRLRKTSDILTLFSIGLIVLSLSFLFLRRKFSYILR